MWGVHPLSSFSISTVLWFLRASRSSVRVWFCPRLLVFVPPHSALSKTTFLLIFQRTTQTLKVSSTDIFHLFSNYRVVAMTFFSVLLLLFAELDRCVIQLTLEEMCARARFFSGSDTRGQKPNRGQRERNCRTIHQAWQMSCWRWKRCTSRESTLSGT